MTSPPRSRTSPASSALSAETLARIEALPTEAKKELRDRLQAQRDRAVAEHRLAQSQEASERVSAYLHDPVGWTRRFVYWRDGEGLAPYQDEVLADVIARRRVAVRGPHGLGKTTGEALAVLWFATTREAAGIDWKVITTAGAWRQLKEYLWPEIHKWSKRLHWDLLGRAPYRSGRELLDLSLSLTYGSAFAVASDNPALIEGAHADHLLYVYDESKSIASGVWDAAEGAFSGATDGREAYALAQSTPGEPAGRFYEIHQRKPGLEDWHARHVTLEETVAAGRVAEDWADRRRRQWGADSAVYANRVLGEFHSSDEDAVIPLAWVELANERWRAWQERRSPEKHGRRVVGVDVARSGEDLTCFAVRQADIVEEIRTFAKQDTMTTTGKAGGLLKDGTGTSVAVVDTDGLGAGVTDRLREQGYRVVAFHAGAKTPRKDRSGELGFVNVRSAAWWNLREMLDPAYGEQVALPPDPELIGDLTAPHWNVLSGSKITVESRDSLVARLGRSPDRGTAVMQAFWTPSQVSTTETSAVVSYDGMDEADLTLSSSGW